jgi:hypothetical protein
MMIFAVLLALASPAPSITLQFTNATTQTLYPITVNGDYCWVSTNPPYPLAPGQSKLVIGLQQRAIPVCSTAVPKPWRVTYGPKGGTVSCITLVSGSPSTALHFKLTTRTRGLDCIIGPPAGGAAAITIKPTP